MKKEKMIKILCTLFLLVFALSLGSSQIIGGEVFSGGAVDPSWQNVFVYNVNNVNEYVEVLVSPDNYRYSFVNGIVGGGEIFSSESVIRAEILDFKNGFAAGPIDMQLSQDNNQYYSCEDCDICPFSWSQRCYCFP